jgi:hypothetical protein
MPMLMGVRMGVDDGSVAMRMDMKGAVLPSQKQAHRQHDNHHADYKFGSPVK